MTPEPVSWVLPAREVVLVLQGEGRIEVEGRTTIIELSPGTMVSLPRGARTTWHITPDFKEFWTLA